MLLTTEVCIRAAKIYIVSFSIVIPFSILSSLSYYHNFGEIYSLHIMH
jgi:hypothetical protein